MVNLFKAKGPRIYDGEKTVSSINGVGKSGQAQANERNKSTILYQSQK